MTDEKLSSLYFDPKNKASFGGPDRLSRAAGTSRNKAKAFLESHETYTLNKDVRHKFKRRKITSHEIDYLWQADLLILSKFSRVNKGYKFILTVIDVLSRWGFAAPLKLKTGKAVTEAFSDIINSSKRKPKFIQTDEGTEFFNKCFKTYLESQNIQLFHNHSPLKAAMVERFNRTLMTRFQKIFTYRKSNVYYDILNDVISAYNSTEHRTIGCAPDSVNKFNQTDIWLKSNKDLFTKAKKAKLKNGDLVRIKVTKNTFTKGYTSKFSTDLYRISQVNQSNPITYSIVSNSGDDILGIFYAEELSLVKI